MLFKLGTRKLYELKEEYARKVRKYMCKYGDDIVEKLSKKYKTKNETVSYEEMQEIVGVNFPKARWMPKSDLKSQMMLFLIEIGVKFAFYESYIQLAGNENIYSQIVKNYLSFSGKGITETLTDYISRRNVKVTYEEMGIVLGKHYPKAPWLDKSNNKMCIIVFLNEMGLSQIMFDDKYVILP